MLSRCITLAAIVSLGLTGSPSAAELKVEIRGVSSTDGSVAVAVFDEPDQFLAKPAQGLRVPAGQNPLVATFTGLQPGTYAISAFHDENDNGALDKNLFGLPTEKYGVSLDAAGFMGPPAFQDAALTVNAQNQIVIINLR